MPDTIIHAKLDLDTSEAETKLKNILSLLETVQQELQPSNIDLIDNRSKILYMMNEVKKGMWTAQETRDSATKE